MPQLVSSASLVNTNHTIIYRIGILLINLGLGYYMGLGLGLGLGLGYRIRIFLVNLGLGYYYYPGFFVSGHILLLLLLFSALSYTLQLRSQRPPRIPVLHSTGMHQFLHYSYSYYAGSCHLPLPCPGAHPWGCRRGRRLHTGCQ